MKRVRVWLQLVRLPNLFTAAADVCAGFVFVGAAAGGVPWRWDALVWLICASVLMYASGVVLNDVFDFARDAAERPDRPIPSGAVSRRSAMFVGGVLLGAGLACCHGADRVVGGVHATWVGWLLASCIVAYDALLKQTPVAPALMGMCRALNLMLGMSIAYPWVTPATMFAAAAMWGYVASLTYFARFEAGATSSLRLKLGAFGVGASVISLIGLQALMEEPHSWYLLAVGALLGELVVRARRAIITGKPRDIQQCVGAMVMGIVLFDACLAFAARGPLAAIAVAAWIVPARFASLVFRVS